MGASHGLQMPFRPLLDFMMAILGTEFAQRDTLFLGALTSNNGHGWLLILFVGWHYNNPLLNFHRYDFLVQSWCRVCHLCTQADRGMHEFFHSVLTLFPGIWV